MVADPVLDSIEKLSGNDERGVVVTLLGTGDKAVLDSTLNPVAGDLPPDLTGSIRHDAGLLLDREKSITLAYDGSEVFYEILSPRPRLFVFGAVHIAQELVRHASLLGFSVVVADPRPAFITTDRFPEADELRVGWPADICDVSSFDERTFVVVLTHDRRFEDPLWPIVLPSPARYIGAMGSSKTTAGRRERLLADGFAPEQIDRIHGPIGLDIGSRTAGEVAIAILGEMIASRYLHEEPADLIGQPARV